MTHLQVRCFAAARSATGTDHERVSADTVEQALAMIRARHGARFDAVLAVSSLLLDGVHVGDLAAPSWGDAELDVLPRFAGG